MHDNIGAGLSRAVPASTAPADRAFCWRAAPQGLMRDEISGAGAQLECTAVFVDITVFVNHSTIAAVGRTVRSYQSIASANAAASVATATAAAAADAAPRAQKSRPVADHDLRRASQRHVQRLA